MSVCGTVLFLAAHASAADDWVGRKVFVKETAKPKAGDRTLPWNAIAFPAAVERVNGDWLWLGKAWVRTGEVVPVEDAPAYYTRVLRQTPDAAYAYLLRGVAWALKREYDNAIKDYDQALRLEPGVHLAYHARGEAYHAKHEYEKALADMSEAIRLAPDMALYYNDRGCIYNSLDEYKKAHEQFNEAIRMQPKLALAYANRGANWHDQKEYEKALADFDKAIEIDATLTHAYNSRGYVWSKMGRYGRALEDWDESIRIAPYEPWGYHNKARLWATCQSLSHLDGKAAVDSATKACELSHWDDWLCITTLAAAYAEIGQFDDATKWQKKAIEMNRHPKEKDRLGAQERLALYQSGMPFRDPEVSQTPEGGNDE